MMMLVLILPRIYIFTSGSAFRRWQGVPLLVIYIIFTLLAVKFGVLG